MDIYVSYFLRCGCGETIPLPHPNLQEAIAIQTGEPREIRKAVFACTECGLVSAYSSEDVRAHPSPTPDPHRQGTRTLFYIEPQCDKTQCEAQKRLYLLGTGPATIGEGVMKVRPKDWRFAPSATCTGGHALKLSLDIQYRLFQEFDSPL
jgi:hypothetical protein